MSFHRIRNECYKGILFQDHKNIVDTKEILCMGLLDKCFGPASVIFGESEWELPPNKCYESILIQARRKQK